MQWRYTKAPSFDVWVSVLSLCIDAREAERPDGAAQVLPKVPQGLRKILFGSAAHVSALTAIGPFSIHCNCCCMRANSGVWLSDLTFIEDGNADHLEVGLSGGRWACGC